MCKYIEDIQLFLLNMAFISSSEVENIYIDVNDGRLPAYHGH